MKVQLMYLGYGNTGCEEFRGGVQKYKVNSFKGNFDIFLKWNGSVLNGHAWAYFS